MATLRPIHNHIVFQFEQTKTKHMGITQFQEKTDWGFEFANTNDSLETGRWVRVAFVGHEVPEEIKPGMRVCIEKLMWSNEFEFEGELYWRTDYDQVLLIDETVEPNNN